MSLLASTAPTRSLRLRAIPVPGSGTPRRTVNGVYGAGLHAGSLDVFSLDFDSDGSNYIILRWSGRKVVDGNGIDFIVL